MSEDPIIIRLRDILRESSPEDRDWDRVGADTTIESLGIDSISILDLLYDVDQEFDVHLEAADVLEVRTVGEIADLLRERGA